MTREPFVIGHRGSPRRAPENTPQSFELALAEGAHGVETDLRRLRDGEIILFHDSMLHGERVEGLTGAGFRSLTGRDPVPLSAIRTIDSARLRVLEVKSRGWEQELLDAVSGWSGIVISSFDHRVLARCRDLGWSGRLGAVLEGVLVESERYLAALGVDVFFPQVQFVDAALVAAHRDAGIDVIPWTVNVPAQARELIAWGCAGIITDDARLMVGPDGLGLPG